MRLTAIATEKFRVHISGPYSPETKFWVAHRLSEVKAFVDRHNSSDHMVDSIIFYTEYVIEVLSNRQRFPTSIKFGLIAFTPDEIRTVTEDILNHSRKVAKAEFDAYTNQRFGSTLNVTNSSEDC